MNLENRDVVRVKDLILTATNTYIKLLRIKTIPKKKKCRKAKWLSEEALQIAEKRKQVKSKGKRKGIPN